VIPTVRLGKPWPKSTASATAKATAAPASTPTGRVIGNEL
jgi:hypothetical protein